MKTNPSTLQIALKSEFFNLSTPGMAKNKILSRKVREKLTYIRQRRPDLASHQSGQVQSYWMAVEVEVWKPRVQELFLIILGIPFNYIPNITFGIGTMGLGLLMIHDLNLFDNSKNKGNTTTNNSGIY